MLDHLDSCPTKRDGTQTCNCGATPTNDLIAKVILKLKKLKEDRVKTRLSYSFRFRAVDDIEVPSPWSSAEDVELDLSGAPDVFEFITDGKGSKIKFPYEAVEYKDMRVKVMRQMTTTGGEEGVTTMDEHGGRRTEMDIAGLEGQVRTTTPSVNPDDLATLLPFLLNDRDRLMIQVVLSNHFRVTNQHDRKAAALTLFMNWSRTIDPTSTTYNVSVALGRDLLNSLRIASVCASTRTPEHTVNSRLDTATTEDPLTRVAADLQRQNANRRGQSSSFSRGGGNRVLPGNGKPRACKYCGQMHTQGWDTHDCPKWCSRCKKPKSPGDHHKC